MAAAGGGDDGSGGGNNSTTPARKVMVVVDINRESAAALQYTLSHALLENDKLILLCIDNPNAWKNPFGAIFKKQTSTSSYGGGGGASISFTSLEGGGSGSGGEQTDIVESMMKICKSGHPELEVMVERVEIGDGKDKASIILSESTKHGVELLVIGQKRSFSNAILGTKRGGSLRGLDTAEYLIENSKCTCVAVQKKGQNAGYLLNTKTHRNFWLLA